MTEIDIPELNPEQVWEVLTQDPDTALVDVRTRPEWTFVGGVDLRGIDRQVIRIEWQTYPDMKINKSFSDQLLEKLDGDLPKKMFFICRSGARSLYAAQSFSQDMAHAGNDVCCFNVAEGFEGDLDEWGHRGSINGWKYRGLSWCQY